MNKSLICILLLLLIVITNCLAIYNDDYYGDCNYIKQDLNNEPTTIYTLTYSNKTNNIFISKNQINDNSITTLLYKLKKKTNSNQFEFISITSNDSILVQSIGHDPFIISDNKNESPFSYRWDKPLYHPYLSYQCNNSYANITAITFSIINNSTSATNNNNSTALNNSTSINNSISILSILSGSIVGVDNVKSFEHESNIVIDSNEIKSFKSSFDRVNLVHYSYIKEKERDNYYLIKSELNNNNSNNTKSSTSSSSSSYLVNTGLDFDSVGLSSNNGTLVIAGYDLKTNTTKYYQVIINNNNTSTNNSTSKNTTTTTSNEISIKLIMEYSIKVSNSIKSSNPNYLIFYSSSSNKVLVLNISTMKFNSYNITIHGKPYKESSNDDYDSFIIQDMFASGAQPSISNTKFSIMINNNNSTTTKSNTKVIVISIVVIGIAVLLFGSLGFYVFYIRRNRLNKFTKIDDNNNNNNSNNKSQYPDDNITILLKNYR